jgi:hypothetical protein
MPHPRKIILHCPHGYDPRIDLLVEEFIRDGVVFVGVAGKDSTKIEDTIDEIVLGDGTRNYELLTSSHETVEDALDLAGSMSGDFSGDTHVLTI